MKTKDLQDNIVENFEVSKMPPVGPDGSLGIEPQRPVPDPRPRLCEAGPCRNYHRLRVQVDSEEPRAIRLPFRLPVIPDGVHAVGDGMMYRPPQEFHTELHHACYPTVGIEIDLGPEPIVECNRWHPLTEHEHTVRPSMEGARNLFLASPAGVAYQRELAAWDERRDAKRAAADAIQAEIDAAMAAYETENAARSAQLAAEADQVREQTEAERTLEAIESHRAAYEAAHPKQGDQ